MNFKKVISLFAALLLVMGAGCTNFDSNEQEQSSETDVVVTTEPTVEATTTANTGVAASVSVGHELVRVTNPLVNQEISSPLEIEGEASGVWFFEGDASVVLTDWDGSIIAEGYITATGDWMTEEFVPFSGELQFVAPLGNNKNGSLVLQKDNPSGLPENDDEFEIPILFE